MEEEEEQRINNRQETMVAITASQVAFFRHLASPLPPLAA
jgi:hypothetical protein